MYINGGKRFDSTSDYSAPDLSAEAASMLVKSHNEFILQHSAKKLGLGKAFEDAARYKKLKVTEINNPLTCPSFLLYIGNSTTSNSKRIKWTGMNETNGMTNGRMERMDRSNERMNTRKRKVFKTSECFYVFYAYAYILIIIADKIAATKLTQNLSSIGQL